MLDGICGFGAILQWKMSATDLKLASNVPFRNTSETRNKGAE
jgi:hypothetical protein